MDPFFFFRDWLNPEGDAPPQEAALQELSKEEPGAALSGRLSAPGAGCKARPRLAAPDRLAPSRRYPLRGDADPASGLIRPAPATGPRPPAGPRSGRRVAGAGGAARRGRRAALAAGSSGAVQAEPALPGLQPW